MIVKATIAIPDAKRRTAAAHRITRALRTEKLFPEQWRSEPNVMFTDRDPRPRPFD